jgi:hypothetical protein
MEPGTDEHQAQLQKLRVFLAGLKQELRLFEEGKWVPVQECAFCNDLVYLDPKTGRRRLWAGGKEVWELVGDAGRYPFGYYRAEGIDSQTIRGKIHEFCACREENTGRAWAQARMEGIERPVGLFFRRPIWIENPLFKWWV